MPGAIVALVAATVIVGVLSISTGPLGLQASLATADRPLGESIITSGTGVLSWQSAQQLAAGAGGGPLRIRWDGYLMVPATREYELRVVSDAPVTLWIDSRAVFEGPGSPDPPARRVRLTQGAHLVGLAYGPFERPLMIDAQWDVGNRFRLASLPLEALSPRPLRGWKWSVRRFLPTAALAVGTAWSLAMLLGAWLWMWRIAGRELEPTRPLRLTLAGLAAVFLAGIWWGGVGGWQPDAIDPESVRTAMLEGFAGGWHDKYPPLHYYLLALLYLPTMVADWLGWLTVHSGPTQLALTLTGRMLSVLMGMGTVLAIAIVAARTASRDHAWPAALCAGCFLPFAFYAKATNVDLPFVFWFAWSLVCLASLLGAPPVATATRSAALLGVTAAAAVATKDQAYALYLLPALMLLWRFGRTAAGWRILAAGAFASVVTLALLYNVLFNPRGLPLHLEFIQGRASTSYRMFEPSAAGQWDLLKSSAGQMLSVAGVAGVVLIAASAGSPMYRRSRTVLLALAVSALSYYAFFIAYAGYVYDRFLLPVGCILAIFAAIGFRRLLAAGTAPRLVAVLLLAWIAARAVATDLLLIRDSRVVAERWLEARLRKEEVVAAVNQFGNIPRLYDFKRTWISPTIDSTLAAGPDYVVVNREHSLRAAPGTEDARWRSWLESSGGPYEEVFRYKASMAWTPLWWDSRFADRVQDPFTNLDKANPEIVIFRRVRRPGL